MSTPTVSITLSRRRLFLILAVFGLATGVVGGSAVWAGGQIFSDVPPTHPFYNQIQWAANAHVVNGYADGTFRPSNTVTRQAAVAFLANYNNSLHLVEESIDPLASHTFLQVANCDPGWRALAGGGNISVTNAMMTDAEPVDDVTPGDSWLVRWESDNDTMADPDNITVWALCAPPLN